MFDVKLWCYFSLCSETDRREAFNIGFYTLNLQIRAFDENPSQFFLLAELFSEKKVAINAWIEFIVFSKFKTVGKITGWNLQVMRILYDMNVTNIYYESRRTKYYSLSFCIVSCLFIGIITIWLLEVSENIVDKGIYLKFFTYPLWISNEAFCPKKCSTSAKLPTKSFSYSHSRYKIQRKYIEKGAGLASF